MRNRDMLAWEKAHPPDELDPDVAAWRRDHPGGTLEDLVRDLKLWREPGDEDAQRLAWYSLKRLGDPAAVQEGGFGAMRGAAMIVPAVRDAGQRISPGAGTAVDWGAGAPPRWCRE